jgi:hypothetical protein
MDGILHTLLPILCYACVPPGYGVHAAFPFIDHQGPLQQGTYFHAHP